MRFFTGPSLDLAKEKQGTGAGTLQPGGVVVVWLYCSSSSRAISKVGRVGFPNPRLLIQPLLQAWVDWISWVRVVGDGFGSRIELLKYRPPGGEASSRIDLCSRPDARESPRHGGR